MNGQKPTESYDWWASSLGGITHPWRSEDLQQKVLQAQCT